MQSPIISIEDARTEIDPWPEAISLDQGAPAKLDLSRAIPSCLPDLRAYCTGLAEALQVSEDAIAPLALSTFSIATSRAYIAEVRAGWRETPCLWVAVLAESGERKSALVSAMSQPFYGWQRRESERLKTPIAVHQEKRKTCEAKLNSKRSKLVATPPGVEHDGLAAEVRDLAVELDAIPTIHTPNLITNDATPEAIRDLMVRNGEKLAWISAEVDPCQLMGSQYSKTGQSNFDLFLKAFSGEPVAVARVNRGDVHLRAPCLSMALFVQPAAMNKVLSDAYAVEKGLVPRLCLIRPTSKIGTRQTRPEPVPNHLIEWWEGVIFDTLNQAWSGKACLEGPNVYLSESSPVVVNFTEQALIKFEAFMEAHESRLAEDGDLRPILAFGSKLPGVLVRIALNFAVLRSRGCPIIDDKCLCAALEWAPFLIDHFRFAVGEAGLGKDLKLARRLLRFIRTKSQWEFSARDALRWVDSAGARMEDIIPALELLEERGWIREQSNQRSSLGRPASTRYLVHPSISH